MVSTNGNTIFQRAGTVIFHNLRVWILQKSLDFVSILYFCILTFLYLDKNADVV